VAPIPCSSGNQQRHRLHRGGDRRLNHVLPIIAVTRAQHDPATRDYLARKQAEGKTKKSALRCLKRHLARRFHRLLSLPAEPDQERGIVIEHPAHPSRSDRADTTTTGPAPTPMPCLTYELGYATTATALDVMQSGRSRKRGERAQHRAKRTKQER
jgi:hypothetical protein